MKHLIFSILAFFSTAALAEPAKLHVTSSAFGHGQPIPEKYAFCAPASKDGGNVNPALRWSGAPEGTKSFAILVVDPDVPAVFDDANKEGKTLPKDMPRQNFYHWVLTDIPASMKMIGEGMDSQGVIKTGKPTGKTAYGTSYANDYKSFMEGTFGGYDGPCPPFNDERLHHYHFRVYALGVEKLDVPADATGKQVETALTPHILAQGEWVGTYTRNLSLRGK